MGVMARIWIVLSAIWLIMMLATFVGVMMDPQASNVSIGGRALLALVFLGSGVAYPLIVAGIWKTIRWISAGYKPAKRAYPLPQPIEGECASTHNCGGRDGKIVNV